MASIIYKIYEYFFGYFTGSSRRNIFWAFIISLILVVIGLSLGFKVSMALETLYWTFSSLIQALLALVGLMGVVSIFKLQAVSTNEQALIKDAQLLYNNVFLDEEKLRRIVANENNSTQELLKNKLEKLDLSRSIVTDNTLDFVVYTFGVVLANLVALMLAVQIEAHYLGFPMLVGDFILSSYSLFLATKGVAAAIQK